MKIVKIWLFLKLNSSFLNVTNYEEKNGFSKKKKIDWENVKR